MPTPRDQLDAYVHDQRRRVTAFVAGTDETDPRRRAGRSLVGGVMVAVVLLAVAGVVGYLGGGPATPLPTSGVVLVADSGERYVVREGVLHPTLNLVSALLVAGPDVTTVAASALDGRPRGQTLGIPAAPDVLPAALTGGPWTLCTTPGSGVTVVLDRGAGPEPPAADVMVRDDRGGRWLLAEGRRYAVPATAVGVLGVGTEPAVLVPPRVLGVVPRGPDLTPPVVAGAGATPSVALPFVALVGDVVGATVADGRHSYFLVVADGLAPVDPVAYALLGVRAQHRIEVVAGDATSVLSAAPAPVPDLWPSRLPSATPVGQRSPVCLRAGADGTVSVSRPTVVPLGPGTRLLPRVSGATPTTRLAVPPGAGAVLRVDRAGADPAYTLVTDSGVAFPLQGPEALRRLGYAVAQALTVPAGLVAVLPSGPLLDVDAAATEYVGSAAGP